MIHIAAMPFIAAFFISALISAASMPVQAQDSCEDLFQEYEVIALRTQASHQEVVTNILNLAQKALERGRVTPVHHEGNVIYPGRTPLDLGYAVTSRRSAGTYGQPPPERGVLLTEGGFGYRGIQVDLTQHVPSGIRVARAYDQFVLVGGQELGLVIPEKGVYAKLAMPEDYGRNPVVSIDILDNGYARVIRKISQPSPGDPPPPREFFGQGFYYTEYILDLSQISF